MSIKQLKYKQRAFTLIELLVGIAIVGILATVALPSLSRFAVGMRVESEVTELHRLILMTRNTAINTGNPTIICPIVTGKCANNWDKEISVFEDINADGDFDAGDRIIKVKAAAQDQLVFSVAGTTLLRFTPVGILAGSTANATFSYCPNGYTDESKGVLISPLGRPSISQDTNNDGFDQDRAGVNISCS